MGKTTQILGRFALQLGPLATPPVRALRRQALYGVVFKYLGREIKTVFLV
jgi:hypothetical protein